MAEINTAKIINELNTVKATRSHLFKTLEPKRQGFILLKLTSKSQKEIIKNLSEEELLNLLSPLDPDKATDVLQLLPQEKAQKLTESLNDTLKEKVEFLLKFNPKAAAGLMNLNYILIEKSTPFKEILKELIDYEAKSGKFPSILIIEDGKLLGELPGSVLAIHRDDSVKDKYLRKVLTIKFDSELHKVIRSFIKTQRVKLRCLTMTKAFSG